jgi:hypothetical protein
MGDTTGCAWFGAAPRDATLHVQAPIQPSGTITYLARREARGKYHVPESLETEVETVGDSSNHCNQPTASRYTCSIHAIRDCLLACP